MEPNLFAIRKAGIPFVMERRKENGVFGATPKLPPTIEDTYHALNILQLVQQYDVLEDNEFDPSTDKKLHSYLADAQLNLPAGMRTTFQLLWCCNTAGLVLDKDTVEANIMTRIHTSIFLEDWYYGIRIFTEVLDKKHKILPDTPNLKSLLNNKWRAVDEAWKHMYLSWKLRNAFPKPKAELIEWFQKCQNGDGGFGFFPGTTSFVENCYACLRSLSLLGEKPLHQDRALRFLTGCQTATGGFGRSRRAVAFLDSTWHALAAFEKIR